MIATSVNISVSIIDGPYLAYRAFCVGGRPAMLDAFVGVVLRRLGCDHRVSVVWEQPGGRGLNFRRQIDPGYKSRREDKPKEFLDALETLQQGLTWIGAHQAWPKEGEADDAGATLCRRALANRQQVELWTADHDWLQLIRPGVSCWDPHHKRRVDHENIVELTGGDAAWHLNRMTLAGDLGDDVPGLPKIGKGRAEKLLEICPAIVQMVLGGNGSDVERVVASKAPNMLRWAQVAIDNVELMKNTRHLVEMVDVPLLEVPPRPSVESAQDWLRGHGLGRYLGQLICPPEPEPWETEKEPWE